VKRSPFAPEPATAEHSAGPDHARYAHHPNRLRHVLTAVRHTARVPTLRIAQDPAADELLGCDPLALLIGMLLDQHMRERSSEPCVGGRC
jgi:hypothetical protein